MDRQARLEVLAGLLVRVVGEETRRRARQMGRTQARVALPSTDGRAEAVVVLVGALRVLGPVLLGVLVGVPRLDVADELGLGLGRQSGARRGVRGEALEACAWALAVIVGWGRRVLLVMLLLLGVRVVVLLLLLLGVLLDVWGRRGRPGLLLLHRVAVGRVLRVLSVRIRWRVDGRMASAGVHRCVRKKEDRESRTRVLERSKQGGDVLLQETGCIRTLLSEAFLPTALVLSPSPSTFLSTRPTLLSGMSVRAVGRSSVCSLSRAIQRRQRSALAYVPQAVSPLALLPSLRLLLLLWTDLSSLPPLT